ncbi:MAG: DUF4038 domain-containing protein [Fimbriimonadaceae bacterium]|nr:DUF4038 domain-containing protein [Fimbriimonadaceae bacterium]
MAPLTLSAECRTLAHADGSPFFWLADTAWELLHCGTREDFRHYLDTRKAQGFNVVQTVQLGEINGLDEPNAYGHVPLAGDDVRTIRSEVLDLTRDLITMAAERNMVVALLPTWGCHVTGETHPLFRTPKLFDVESAAWYGAHLAATLGDLPNLVWVLGGDRPALPHADIWRAMAEPLHHTGHLLTYHPGGQQTSGDLHAEGWLDFHMVQSGHLETFNPAVLIRPEWDRSPAKPVLNGEPLYEHIPLGLDSRNPRSDANQCLDQWVRSLLAGSCGFTYGANEIWMMWTPDREPISPVVTPPFLGADTPWREALHLPGANLVAKVREYFFRDGFADRIPTEVNGEPALHFPRSGEVITYSAAMAALSV